MGYLQFNSDSTAEIMKYFNTIYAHSMRCLRFSLAINNVGDRHSPVRHHSPSQPNARRDVTQHSVNAENSLETHIKNFQTG